MQSAGRARSYIARYSCSAARSARGVAGEAGVVGRVTATAHPLRFRRLPTAEVASRRVPVAVTLLSRLLGLALLSPGRAGEGLLIPRCRSVHTFGMRFRDRRRLPRRRAGADRGRARGAAEPRRRASRAPRAVLELPAARRGRRDAARGSSPGRPWSSARTTQPTLELLCDHLERRAVRRAAGARAPPTRCASATTSSPTCCCSTSTSPTRPGSTSCARSAPPRAPPGSYDPELPVIVLSGRGTEADRAARARLRRRRLRRQAVRDPGGGRADPGGAAPPRRAGRAGPLRVGEIVVDPSRREVRVAGEPVAAREQGVQPAADARLRADPGVHQGRAAARRLGLSLAGPDPDARLARQPPAAQARSRGRALRGQLLGRRLPAHRRARGRGCSSSIAEGAAARLPAGAHLRDRGRRRPRARRAAGASCSTAPCTSCAARCRRWRSSRRRRPAAAAGATSSAQALEALGGPRPRGQRRRPASPARPRRRPRARRRRGRALARAGGARGALDRARLARERLAAGLRRGGDRAGARQPDRERARARQRPDPRRRDARARRAAAADGRRRRRRGGRRAPPSAGDPPSPRGSHRHQAGRGAATACGSSPRSPPSTAGASPPARTSAGASAVLELPLAAAPDAADAA